MDIKAIYGLLCLSDDVHNRKDLRVDWVMSDCLSACPLDSQKLQY